MYLQRIIKRFVILRLSSGPPPVADALGQPKGSARLLNSRRIFPPPRPLLLFCYERHQSAVAAVRPSIGVNSQQVPLSEGEPQLSIPWLSSR